MWTPVAKPTGTPYTGIAKPTSGYTIRAGMLTLFPAPVTYAVTRTFGKAWTAITKPGGQYLGSELVVNGTFDGNANGWLLDSGWTYVSNHVHNDGSTTFIGQITSTILGGLTYRFQFDVSNSNNGRLVGGFDDPSGLLFDITTATNGHYTFDGTAVGNIPDIFIGSQGFSGDIDNVSVKQIITGQNWTSISKPT